jgi:hypothetical protein
MLLDNDAAPLVVRPAEWGHQHQYVADLTPEAIEALFRRAADARARSARIASVIKGRHGVEAEASRPSRAGDAGERRSGATAPSTRSSRAP